jgi:septin 2
MVVGESGLGKSTLIKSLFQADVYANRIIPSAQENVERTVKIEATTVDIEERGVKLRLTVVDTPGFADAINSENCFNPIVEYIDSQYEKYLQDESGLNRRHIIDCRVHCCYYFINPIGHGLKPLDVAFMKAVHSKVNIVPIIAKADTLTRAELAILKQRVMSEIEKYGIQLYVLPECDDDEDPEYKDQCKQLKEAIPFAVIGSDAVLEVRSRKVRGRQYPWGVVEVENPEQCDFVKLRTMLITHMQDLQEVTHEIHYENFRSDKMANGGGGATKRLVNKTRNTSSDVYEKDEKLTEKERQLVEKDAELQSDRRIH